MWDNIEKEKERSKSMSHPRRNPSNAVVAPDLLKDLLEKGVKGNSGRISPGKSSPGKLHQDKKE